MPCETRSPGGLEDEGGQRDGRESVRGRCWGACEQPGTTSMTGAMKRSRETGKRRACRGGRLVGSHMMMPSVVSAEYKGGHRIRLAFSEGTVKTVDFRKWLEGPVFQPLKDTSYFGRFFLEAGTIVWPNGADIAPETLYKAKGVRARRSNGRRARLAEICASLPEVDVSRVGVGDQHLAFKVRKKDLRVLPFRPSRRRADRVVLQGSAGRAEPACRGRPTPLLRAAVSWREGLGGRASRPSRPQLERGHVPGADCLPPHNRLTAPRALAARVG